MRIKQIFYFVVFIITISFPCFSGPYFDAFKEKQMPLLVDFGRDNLDQAGTNVFYPFGGPDVTYPLLMFPNLETLTIVGLESAKFIADYPVKLSNGSLRNLSSLYKSSFFRTLNMAQDGINITALMLKQLENLGAIDVVVQSIGGRENAIEINFTYNAKARKVRYYKAGLSNSQIDVAFIERLLNFDVLLFKAASYLPHRKEFSIFSNLMLEHARMIVQDSTGIPFKDLKDRYDLTLVGQYLKPYEFPSAPKQEDFRKYSENLNNSLVKFSFGYGGGFVPTNILIAKKRIEPSL